jgi:hypothetical protein
MTTPEERTALGLLAGLRSRGWVFSLQHSPDRPDDVDSVFGSYSYRDVHDTLRFWSATEAYAARVRLNVTGYPPRPDYLWNFSGTLCATIDELTRLPHPDAPNAPKLTLPAGRVSHSAGFVGHCYDRP